MDPDLEKRLKELEKKSKYAPLREVSQKLRQGVYAENAKQLKTNKKNLTKKVQKWKRKIEKGDEKEIKTYLGKFEFGQGLLDLLAGKKEKKEEKKVEKKKVESDSDDDSNSNNDNENENEDPAEFKDETEDQKKKRMEEKQALLKQIGEAATSLPAPDIKVELAKLSSLVPPLAKEIADEIKKTDEYKEAFEKKTTEFQKGNFEVPNVEDEDTIIIQAAANAARAFEEVQDKVELFPVVQKETLATGDCFYSAIYRSAKERGYLDELVECMGLDIENEKKFIQSLRNVIADEIYNDRLPGEKTREGYLDSYDFLLQNYATDPKMYKELIRGFPFWFQAKFKDGPGDKKTFLAELALHTMTMTQWVGEIEVKIAQRLFKNYCGIEIHTHRERDEEEDEDEEEIKMPKMYKGSPVFHVVNLGEAHYEYYSFKIPISKIKQASKGVKVEKKADEPCGDFLYDPCTGLPIMEGDPITIITNRLKKIQAKPKKGGTRKRKH